MGAAAAVKEAPAVEAAFLSDIVSSCGGSVGVLSNGSLSVDIFRPFGSVWSVGEGWFLRFWSIGSCTCAATQKIILTPRRR